MVYWTFQKKDIIKRVIEQGLWVPSLEKGDKCEYILALYNDTFNKEYKGLVFGYGDRVVENGPRFGKIESLIKNCESICKPGEVIYNYKMYSLLKLYVPNNIDRLVVEYSRVANLLNNDDTVIDDIKRDLLKPCFDNRYELPMTIIPYIYKNWIHEVYNSW